MVLPNRKRAHPPGTQRSQTLNAKNCSREIRAALLLGTIQREWEAIAQTQTAQSKSLGGFLKQRGNRYEKTLVGD